MLVSVCFCQFSGFNSNVLQRVAGPTSAVGDRDGQASSMALSIPVFE
jgi:hypothetical protein